MAKRKGRDKGRKATPRNKRKPRKRRHIAFRINIEDEPLYSLNSDEEPDERTRKAEEEEALANQEAFGEMMHSLPSIKTDKTRRI